MTVVNTETGEILDPSAAERRAERIRLRLDTIADNYQAVLPLIREAIEKRDDLALGYRSVGDYVSDRFGGALNNLGIEVRREVVRELTDAGMSTRAIAPVVGVSNFTVSKDQAAVMDLTPKSSGAVGSTPAVSEQTPQSEPASPRPARPVVVGLDGKAYTQPPAPRAKPQRALPDQFFDAAFDLTKAVDRVVRLAGDDRFPKNAQKVAAKNRDDLLRARDALDGVIARMP